MHPIKYPCFLNRIEMILHSCFKKQLIYNGFPKFISMISSFKLNAHICLSGSDDFCYSRSLTNLHSEKRAPWVYFTKDYTTVKLTVAP